MDAATAAALHQQQQLMQVQALQAQMQQQIMLQQAQAAAATALPAAAAAAGIDMASPDTIFVSGLPAQLTDEGLRQVFAQYAAVAACKMVPQNQAGLVKVADAAQAKQVMEYLNGKVPNGLFAPVTVKLASEVAQQMQQAAAMPTGMPGLAGLPGMMPGMMPGMIPGMPLGAAPPPPKGPPPPLGVPPPPGKGALGNDGDWECPTCGNNNFRRREACNRCQAPRPDNPVRPGAGKGGRPGTNLFVKGLPAGITDAKATEVFSQYGSVLSVRVLAPKEGKSTTAGFIRMSEEDARWIIDNLNNGVPTGLETPINVSFADAADSSKGKGRGKESDMLVTEVTESDNLFVKGLPGDMTESQLFQTFAQYGNVVSVKVLPGQSLDGGRAPARAAGFVRMSTAEEAKKIMQVLNNTVLNGLTMPVSIKFAGDGVPLVQKVQRALETGEKMHFGGIKAYSAERKIGYIECEEIMRTQGVEVTTHVSVMERGLAGPGDYVVFFLHWRGNQPQATMPMMRIGAYCGDGMRNFALKGWYKGVADLEKGHGFLECAEAKILFRRDVYVPAEMTAGLRPGWVSFNCRIHTEYDESNGREVLLPMCSEVENCPDGWKPQQTMGDLTKDFEEEPPLTGSMDPWTALNNVMCEFIGDDKWVPASLYGGGMDLTEVETTPKTLAFIQQIGKGGGKGAPMGKKGCGKGDDWGQSDNGGFKGGKGKGPTGGCGAWDGPGGWAASGWAGGWGASGGGAGFGGGGGYAAGAWGGPGPKGKGDFAKGKGDFGFAKGKGKGEDDGGFAAKGCKGFKGDGGFAGKGFKGFKGGDDGFKGWKGPGCFGKGKEKSCFGKESGDFAPNKKGRWAE